MISTESYYKDVQGISSQSQGFLNQYQTEITTGSYAVNGLDFLINKKFDKISTWLSYTYADNEYTFEAFEEVNFPNNIDITHSLGFGTSFTNNDFKVSAGVNWHTGRPTTLPELNNEVSGNTINYNPANSSRIKEYLRVDFSATYKFNLINNVRARAGISTLNGINQENIISNYFRIDNNAAKEISNKALQFTPNFSFRVEF